MTRSRGRGRRDRAGVAWRGASGFSGRASLAPWRRVRKAWARRIAPDCGPIANGRGLAPWRARWWGWRGRRKRMTNHLRGPVCTHAARPTALDNVGQARSRLSATRTCSLQLLERSAGDPGASPFVDREPIRFCEIDDGASADLHALASADLLALAPPWSPRPPCALCPRACASSSMMILLHCFEPPIPCEIPRKRSR